MLSVCRVSFSSVWIQSGLLGTLLCSALLVKSSSWLLAVCAVLCFQGFILICPCTAALRLIYRLPPSVKSDPQSKTATLVLPPVVCESQFGESWPPPLPAQASHMPNLAKPPSLPPPTPQSALWGRYVWETNQTDKLNTSHVTACTPRHQVFLAACQNVATSLCISVFCLPSGLIVLY